MIDKHCYCVIFAGGIGTRFWPVSREAKPKQFHSLTPGGKTFLRMTYERFAGLFDPENIIVVSLTRYKELVEKELPELPEENILLEPYCRNTAPSMTYAAYSLIKRDPEAVMVVTPADHMVGDVPAFHQCLVRALDYARVNDALITLGIIPDHPDTNFGYIQGIGDYDGVTPIKVKTFTEKPDAELAEVFFQSGEFYWNSGIYAWRADVICRELEKYVPEITSLFKGWETNIGTAWEQSFLERVYTDSAKISVDVAIMEKTEKSWLFPSSFGWHDVGNWEALYSYLSADDPNGNAVSADKMIFNDNKGTMVYSDESGKMVVINGLQDFLVVDTDDVLMICPRKGTTIKKVIANIAMPDCEEFR